jgi:hypothetical protein
MTKNRNEHSSMDRRIDGLRLRENDRQAAKAHMRDADIAAELIFRTAENLRSAEGLLAGLFVRRAR